MKESKFTPGPWKVSIRPLAITVWADAISLYPIAHIGERNRDEKEANAHLIAASPDLLAACEAFVEAWEKSHQLEKTDVAVRMAKEAIAKAKGGEQ